MNPIIRVLMCEIVGKAVLFGYRSDGQLLLLWGAKKWQDVSLSDKLSQQPAPQPCCILRQCSGSGAFDENLPFG